MDSVFTFLGNNLEVVGFALTFIVGLLIKSPIYNKVIDVTKLITKALEDGKVTKAELQSIIDEIQS